MKKTSKSNVILLLTACIKPNVTDTIAVSDWHERQRMYVEAVQWYVDNTPYEILFVENSGTDISQLVNDKDGRVEFLTFNSPPTVPDRSRSYKEMEILEYAKAQSKTLNRGGMTA